MGGRDLENFRLFVCAIHFSRRISRRRAFIARIFRTTRLFISGNKLRIFLENSASASASAENAEISGEVRIHGAPRIRIKYLYGERESIKGVESRGADGGGVRGRKALREIYLSPSRLITEEIWLKKLSFWNLNPPPPPPPSPAVLNALIHQ